MYEGQMIEYTVRPLFGIPMSWITEIKTVKENEFFNALQVKFSYAITCHKSQGGQWNTVFIEQPYLPNGIDKDYIRWLYTAVTRAKDKLYLIGFKDENFEE
jgi:ATP-dependent exoDNAse (exonuclease V) alpha subunit